MAASPHSWDFLLLRLRELRLPLLRGSASRTSGPTAKSIADILPRGGWQSKISGSASLETEYLRRVTRLLKVARFTDCPRFEEESINTRTTYGAP